LSVIDFLVYVTKCVFTFNVYRYTREAANRLWPPAAVEALGRFLGDGPESWRSSASSAASVPR
jgi:hypothetical protein